MRSLLIGAIFFAAGIQTTAAQIVDAKMRAENGMKPSEILAVVESRDDFRYLEEMKWDDNGYYEVVYHTADSARVEINMDARTGEPIDRD